MRPPINRRTATKVKHGRVQQKNRHRPTSHLGLVLHRESPGRGFRHVVTKREILEFIDIVPGWERYSERLERIVLATHDEDCDAAHYFFHREETGAIFLHAWHEDLWVDLPRDYFDAHAAILTRLGVAHDLGRDTVECRFTEAQARAFTLLHIFMHELGHHFDCIQHKNRNAAGSEDFAENFATSHFEPLLPAYCKTFGDPTRHD
jgi:hypothetical protein